MKKLVQLFLLGSSVVAGIAAWIYLDATAPVRQAEEKALKIAREEAGLKGEGKFHLYNGKETIFVLEGKNKKGEDIIVWIPEGGKNPVIRKKAGGISKSQAVDKVKNEKKPDDIIASRLGMENGIPLWEVYYSSGNGLINYYYIHFETGEMYKLIENL